MSRRPLTFAAGIVLVPAFWLAVIFGARMLEIYMAGVSQ